MGKIGPFFFFVITFTGTIIPISFFPLGKSSSFADETDRHHF